MTRVSVLVVCFSVEIPIVLFANSAFRQAVAPSLQSLERGLKI